MARITAGVTTSHVPAVGAAVDMGRTEEPYWKPMFEGYEFSKKWMADHTPDVAIIVYNDHASYFGMEIMPTFAMGIADSFAICDEGYGPRPVPVVEGAPELAMHLAASLILDDFDMTVLNRLDRFHLAAAAIDCVPRVGDAAGHVKQHLRDRLQMHRAWIMSHGEDMPEILDWTWAAAAGDA